MRRLASLSLCSVLSLSVFTVSADESEEPVELREETRCFQAEGLINFIKRFDDLDESRTDTLHAVFEAKIEIRDEGEFPDSLYIKSGDQKTNMVLDDEGLIDGFETAIMAAEPESEICIQDKARAGTPVNQAGAVFNMPLSIRMKNTSGRYDMAELQDGLKDGKAFYKKMVGGAYALLVPKMTHLIVAYNEDDVPLNLSVFNNDAPIATPEAEPFNGAHVIRFKDLKKLGATHIEITGGPHRISPAPSVKTMKKFGFGG